MKINEDKRIHNSFGWQRKFSKNLAQIENLFQLSVKNIQEYECEINDNLTFLRQNFKVDIVSSIKYRQIIITNLRSGLKNKMRKYFSNSLDICSL